MVTLPNELQRRLKVHRQEQVLGWWDRLNDSERQGLLGQLQAIDLELLDRLYAQRDHPYSLQIGRASCRERV